MDPAEHNLTIYRDRDYSKVFVICDVARTPINLTNYSARAQIRPVKDSSELIVSFTVVVVAAEGKITISLTDTQTLALDESKGWWDLELTDPSNLRKNYVEGSVAIKRTVSRAT
jgi:hypothetical protein